MVGQVVYSKPQAIRLGPCKFTAFQSPWAMQLANCRLPAACDLGLQGRRPAVLDRLGFRAVSTLARTMLSPLGEAMNDLIFICTTVAFFAGAWIYTRACERL
jgi:hypothetical protein